MAPMLEMTHAIASLIAITLIVLSAGNAPNGEASAAEYVSHTADDSQVIILCSDYGDTCILGISAADNK